MGGSEMGEKDERQDLIIPTADGLVMLAIAKGV